MTFNTLSHYEWPATPADEPIRRFRWKLWQRFNNSDDDPFISDASLKWASRKRLDRIASPPACDPVMREMQATFCHWIDDEHPSRWLQLVVLPPCDANDLVQTWARSNGHHVIEPPAQEILLDRSADVNVTFDCDAPLVVIPQLERWFLRHQDCMCHVRKLLRQAARAERH